MGKGFVVAAVALVCALTFSAIGEEPLPVVIAKPALPQVTTEVEPVHETAPATLADAARRNDFAAFEALYTSHPNHAFADLHELWTYSQTDRFGAFYGDELYTRYARRYPGFAQYIDEYRVVDSHGAAFWPVSETRSFLLERAEAGAVAAPENRVLAISDQRSAIRKSAAPRPAVKHVATAKVAPPKPVQAPAAPTPAPLIADRRSLIAQAQHRQEPQQTEAGDSAATGRGIFLMILGLVGVGVLTLMLRTPADEESEPREVIPTLKLTSLPPPAEHPEQRKTGSHG